MLEVGANFAEPLSVRSGLLVIGFNLLALRAGVVVVMNIALPGLFLGLGMKRRDFCHKTPLLSSRACCSLGPSPRAVLYGGHTRPARRFYGQTADFLGSGHLLGKAVPTRQAVRTFSCPTARAYRLNSGEP